MNDHMLADDAFLEQAIEDLRRDLPDDDRMRRIEHRLKPLFAPRADPPSHGFVRGVLVVLVLGAVAPQRWSVDGRSHAESRETVAERQREELVSATTTPVDSLPVAAETSREVKVPDARPPKDARASALDTRLPRANPAAREVSPPKGGSPPSDDTDDELGLLEGARRALETDPSTALALTDEHVRRFLRPTLAEERERLAIEALVRLGRGDEVLRRASAFEATYPQSAHRRRVQELVAQ